MPIAPISRHDYLAARAELTPEQLQDYLDYRDAGSSHNLALMCAARQAPGQICTDERWAGDNDGKGSYQHGLVGPGYEGKTDAEIRAGKGDPFAYVSSRGEAYRKMDKRGLVATGNAPRGIPTIAPKTAPTVKRNVKDELASDPKFKAGIAGMARAFEKAT